MRNDLVPGAVFPDYQLPDHTGAPRKLSELQGADPLILTLSRGHYCPKEHQQHLELAAFYPKIAVAYTQLVTISTDDHHTLQGFRASVGAQWTFLSDPDRTVQKDLDIAEYTDPEHNPMIPHTLVLKPGLIIHRIYNGYWFWGRPSVIDLMAQPGRCDERNPPRLGSEDSWTPRGLERGRLVGLPWMEQGSKSGLARTQRKLLTAGLRIFRCSAGGLPADGPWRQRLARFHGPATATASWRDRQTLPKRERMFSSLRAGL